ncbi:MAG: hypothetical protein RRA94_07590 [Bacteroidota bacterium]|nr:hypothetical protein [Bacteroidota bacterium]
MNNRPENVFTLRRVLLVLVLMFMLSFDPAVNTQNLRVERTPVEYILPRRQRRRLRGRRHIGDTPRFSTVEVFFSL